MISATTIRKLEGELKETKEQLKIALNANAKLASALDTSNSTNADLWNTLKEREQEISQLRNQTTYPTLEWARTIGSESGKSMNGSSGDSSPMNKEADVTKDLEEKDTGVEVVRQTEEVLLKEDKQFKRGTMPYEMERRMTPSEYLEIDMQRLRELKSLLKMPAEMEFKTERNSRGLSELAALFGKAEIQEKKKKEQEKERFLASLVGPFTWMKKRISVVDDKKGEVKTTDGKTLTIDEVKKAVEMNAPWMLFPEEYEVECVNVNCKNKIAVSSNVCNDKVSVTCTDCHYSTILGGSKIGFEWVQVFPCDNFQQVPEGTKPEECGLCGTKTTNVNGNRDEYAKMPKRIC